MSRDNLTWGRRRIRSELHLLGYEVAELTVAKYMVRGRKPPSQPPSRSWRRSRGTRRPGICFVTTTESMVPTSRIGFAAWESRRCSLHRARPGRIRWWSPPPIPTGRLNSDPLRALDLPARESPGNARGREACRRTLHGWLVFLAIRPSVAGVGRWIWAKMTSLTGTGLPEGRGTRRSGLESGSRLGATSRRRTSHQHRTAAR